MATRVVRALFAAMDLIDLAMQRYADGDLGAFPELYDALAPRLLARLIQLTTSRERAADLLQETFLRIHARRTTFRRGERVTPWALAIARNVFIDDRRRQRVRPFDAVLGRSIDPAACAGDTDPERVVVARQQTALIRQLLDELTTAQREAILGAVLEQPNGGGAMKLRRFRARRVLARALA
jgi:RNA polymerase sigma-70 factor (ECF subfamily)